MVAILEADRQAQWRERAEQGGKRLYRSRWLIHTLRDYLPPEHVGLAERLATLQAMVDGARIISQRVDHGGNRAEANMVRQIDAARELAGLEQAASVRAGVGARQCFWAIAESDNLESMMARCALPRGSRGRAIKLVQLTLIALDEYLTGNAEDVVRSSFDHQLDEQSKMGSKTGKVL